MTDVNQIKELIYQVMVEYGMQVVGAIAILIIGWIAANWLGKRVKKLALRSEKIDETLVPLFYKGVRILVLVITILTVLNQFGVETASIVAVLATAGLAIGLALQGTLSNIASGMMLLILRPFNVGDSVEVGGVSGVVDEISLFITKMHTFDNIAITLPNSKIWGSKIENYTRNETRRVDMEIGISYDDNIDLAMDIIREILQSEERVLEEPEPLVAVGGLGDNAVILRVRPWTKTADIWPVRYELTKRIKERFDQEDISFPYPQRDIHLYQTGTGN